jgi:hypothetical protein
MQSWVQNQIHLADYLYSNLVKIHLPPTSQKVLLNIAETLFDVGTDLLQKKSLDGAVKYLRWSWDYIQQITRVDKLGLDGRELSVNVRHNLAKALVRRNAGEELDLERARELIDGLALVCLHRGRRGLIVGFAEGVLDVYFEDGVFGKARGFSRCIICESIPLSDSLILALATMVELVDINDATFKRYSSLSIISVDSSITTKIHALDNDVPSAKHCITCLNALFKRLYPLDKLEWLEQSLITRVYLIGKYPPTQTTEGVKDLRRVFDGLLSPKQSLI